MIKPKLKDFKIENKLKEDKVLDNEKLKENILKEISILNSNLQIIYEKFKNKNISKEEYIEEKSLIQDKRYYWRVKWKN